MKKFIFILLVCVASGFAFSQASGIRVNTGSSGKMDVTAEGETVTAYKIYDMNDNLVQAGDIIISNTEKKIDVSSLEHGAYYVVFITESGQVVTKTYFKQED